MKEVFQFLNNLKENNNREWFNFHKTEYELALNTMIDFGQKLLEEMNKHDQIQETTGKKSLFRIYRDVRFSKNKEPYKISWSGRFTRATVHRRGGYYFHLEPGGSRIAGGFWRPNSQDMLHIRKQIQQDSSALRRVLNDKSFQKYFGELQGEQVKTAPKGFAKDDPDIDLLRYKGLVLTHRFTDEEVFHPDFAVQISNGFKKMRPFLDCMSEILTTDLNGVPLV